MNPSTVGARTKTHRAHSVWSDRRGVCLTELMLSLTVGAIVLAATLSTFNMVQAQAEKQYHTVTHQQDLRLGLEVFEQETRLAESDSIVTAVSDEFVFYANVNAQQTMTTSSVVPGQSIIAVQDGSGWGEGKPVRLCGQQTCETHRLSRAGQRSQLTLAEPVGMALSAGASVEVRNRVSYYTKSDGRGLLKLMRMIDGGASVLMGDLESLHFSYRDEDGRITEHPAHVKRVVLKIGSQYRLHRMVREVGIRS